MRGTPFRLDVRPELPDSLTRLEELANNLWYSWDRASRTLFARLDAELWQRVGHSPKAFLRNIDQRRLREAAEDAMFLSALQRVMANYDAYHGAALGTNHAPHMGPDEQIAYFCAEFGLHESLPIYSGGLGILAGDHCKTASDLRLPFVGVGLLYRQGYFQQQIDNQGRQLANYADTEFDLLPIASGHVPRGLVARTLEAAWNGPETLIVVSTDLSHYHTSAEARKLDEESTRSILERRGDLTDEQACGARGVNGLIQIAQRRGLAVEMLDQRNSGDTAGDRSRVVGYGSYAVYEA